MNTAHIVSVTLVAAACLNSQAWADEDLSSMFTAATLESADAAAWLAEREPLIDSEHLAELLSSPDSTVLTTLSNVPMTTADEVDAAGGKDKLAFGLSFAIWTPAISGDIGAGGVTTHVDASFLDILKETDLVFGLSGMMRVSKGKIGGYVGGSYNTMQMEVGPLGRTNVTSDVSILSFGLTYELGRWPVQKTATADLPARDITLLLTAGGRYTGVVTDIDLQVLPDQRGSEYWIDPIVGFAASIPLSQHFSIVGSGEVGGFGVASQFAWAASILLSWDFHIKDCPSSLQFGYLAIGDDYQTGSGRDEFVWNTIMHGMLLNFNIRF